MAGKSDYLENKILNYIFNGGSFSAPANVYIALFTVAPTDAAGSGTEVTGGSYGRAAVACNTGEFPTTTTGVITNANDITFAQASAAWGTIVAFAIMDASSGGNKLYWNTISPPKPIAINDTLVISAGQLEITED